MSSFTAADQPRSLEQAQADRIARLEERLRLIENFAERRKARDAGFGAIAYLAKCMLERRL